MHHIFQFCDKSSEAEQLILQQQRQQQEEAEAVRRQQQQQDRNQLISQRRTTSDPDQLTDLLEPPNPKIWHVGRPLISSNIPRIQNIVINSWRWLPVIGQSVEFPVEQLSLVQMSREFNWRKVE